MKFITSVILFTCLGLCSIAQSSDALLVKDTVVSKITISSEPQDTTKNNLPQLILLNRTQATKPIIENIASEIPNSDTSQNIVRIKVVTTEELVAKEQKIAQAESAPVPTKITAVDTKKTESYADPEDTTVIPGRTYKIQVLALQKESKETLATIQKDLGKQTSVSIEVDDNLNKYMIGEFNTYFSAVTYRDSLVKKGYKGAFVVVYYKGKRVSRQEKGFVKVKK
ncbi:MAG: hypothetical protein MJ197_08075 [Bacteroidales bacterium]|nr:hypothetical protein [Bacteroidales bacterium]